MTQIEFNTWLDHIVMTEHPDKCIIAFWFGIYETTNGYVMYMIGSKSFDEIDNDWACDVDFEPTNKYLNLGQKDTNWEMILNQVKELLNNYFKTPKFKDSFLDTSMAIACGFDDGDLHRLK